MKMEAAHSTFIMGFLKDTSFILKSVFIGNTQMKLQYINITLKKYAERELVLSLTEHCPKWKKIRGSSLKLICLSIIQFTGFHSGLPSEESH